MRISRQNISYLHFHELLNLNLLVFGNFWCLLKDIKKLLILAESECRDQTEASYLILYFWNNLLSFEYPQICLKYKATKLTTVAKYWPSDPLFLKVLNSGNIFYHLSTQTCVQKVWEIGLKQNTLNGLLRKWWLKKCCWQIKIYEIIFCYLSTHTYIKSTNL